MKKLILLFSVILACQFSLLAQDKSYQLSAHILDISSGSPATGVTIRLERFDSLAGAPSSQQMVFASTEDLSATPEKPSVPMKNLKHQKGLVSLPSAASK